MSAAKRAAKNESTFRDRKNKRTNGTLDHAKTHPISQEIREWPTEFDMGVPRMAEKLISKRV
jgi:hypothetical protein